MLSTLLCSRGWLGAANATQSAKTARFRRAPRWRRGGVAARGACAAASDADDWVPPHRIAGPGGNLTGINVLLSELVAKRLELLRELVPAATRVAVLVNPVNAAITETTLRDVDAAARTLGLQIQVVRAGTSREINAVFA